MKEGDQNIQNKDVFRGIEQNIKDNQGIRRGDDSDSHSDIGYRDQPAKQQDYQTFQAKIVPAESTLKLTENLLSQLKPREMMSLSNLQL